MLVFFNSSFYLDKLKFFKIFFEKKLFLDHDKIMGQISINLESLFSNSESGYDLKNIEDDIVLVLPIFFLYLGKITIKSFKKF